MAPFLPFSIVRLLLMLAFALPVGLGRASPYRPGTTRSKAGDLAPDIEFARMLHAPVAGSWCQSNLSGQLTILAFMPDTSHNLQIVERWNAEIQKFDGTPVQFVWITSELESTLLPWLDQHPIKGWAFVDPEGQTGNAASIARRSMRPDSRASLRSTQGAAKARRPIFLNRFAVEPV